MNPEKYIPDIRKKYPKENPYDFVAMIGIVAEARAGERGSAVTAADFEFGGKLLCLIFDPIKFKIVNFSSEMESLRQSYRGIAQSDEAQQMFRESLRPELLTASDVSAAISAGSVETLFRLPATSGEGDDLMAES